MSWRSPVWDVLGIEPTSDQGAIRRAYAARLKAIDPDRDPPAFIALREAFEQARREAQWRDEDDEAEDADFETPDLESAAASEAAGLGFDRAAFDDWSDDGVSLAPPGWPGPAEPAPPAPPRSPWAPPAPEDCDAHARALLQLLDRPDDGPDAPTPEQAEAMRAHWRVLAADPRLQQMGHYVDVERWIAGVLAWHAPFSDPLVRPVTAFFGWMATADEVGQPGDVAYLVQRARVLDFVDALDAPGHPLHAAWNELRTFAGERAKRGKVKRETVDTLLALVRRDYPELEDRFDADRVALWQKKRLPAWVGTIGWWLLIVLAIQGFNLAKCASDDVRPPAPVSTAAKLTDPRADIDRALLLQYEGNLTLGVAEAKNPDLAAALQRQWQDDQRAGKAWASFAISLGEMLDKRYRDGIDNASLDLLRQRQRFVLAEAEFVRSQGAEVCARALRPGDPPRNLPWPPELERRRAALGARVLLDTRPAATPRPATRRFKVPLDVIDAAARRAGLDRAAALRALRYEGPDRAQCDARIAFTQAVMALPDARAEPLLRRM